MSDSAGSDAPGKSGTCTSCGERMLLTDWQEHRERVHGSRVPERTTPMTERTEALTETEREMLEDAFDPDACWCGECSSPQPLYAAVERILASRLAVRDGEVAQESAQVVAGEYEGYLHSDSLDPAWIAGWHSAINHATHALTHRPAPDASGDAGEGGGPTVCIAHGRFIPCRKDGEHRYTSNPYWVKSVSDYQNSPIHGLTWEPAWEADQ